MAGTGNGTAATAKANLRTKIFAARRPKSETVDFGGEKIEVRMPAYGEFLQSISEDQDVKSRSIRMIIMMCYVPGTDERIFDVSDFDAIASMPFDEDMLRLNGVMNKYLGVKEEDVKAAGKKSDQVQTGGTSS